MLAITIFRLFEILGDVQTKTCWPDVLLLLGVFNKIERSVFLNSPLSECLYSVARQKDILMELFTCFDVGRLQTYLFQFQSKTLTPGV